MSTKKELLEKAKEYLKEAEQFTAEQAPLVLQEFWRWEIVSNVMQVLVFLAAVVGVVRFVKYVLRSDWAYEEHWARGEKEANFDAPGYFAVIFSVLLGAFSVVRLLAGVSDLVRIYIAPRIYLLEELRNFL